MDDTTSPTWQLLNIAAAGRAKELLIRARRDGQTYEQIAESIRDDYRIRVSREWVRLRCIALGVEQDAAA